MPIAGVSEAGKGGPDLFRIRGSCLFNSVPYLVISEILQNLTLTAILLEYQSASKTEAYLYDS